MHLTDPATCVVSVLGVVLVVGGGGGAAFALPYARGVHTAQQSARRSVERRGMAIRAAIPLFAVERKRFVMSCMRRWEGAILQHLVGNETYLLRL